MSSYISSDLHLKSLPYITEYFAFLLKCFRQFELHTDTIEINQFASIKIDIKLRGEIRLL